MNIVESGTSVAPRQRPKGSSAHSQKSLGFGLPPSPSPRNNITSPQPQQPVIEQFQANFPALTPAIPPPPIPQTVSSNTTQQQPIAECVSELSKPVNVTHTKTSAPEMLNSLFESTVYPDPFSESLPTPQQQQTTETAGASVEALRRNTIEITTLDSATVTTVTATTTTIAEVSTGDKSVPQLLSPPKSSHANNSSGHRRNVSDTSAFNK